MCYVIVCVIYYVVYYSVHLINTELKGRGGEVTPRV